MYANKRGQMTIFVILGLLVVGLVVGYLVVRGGLLPGSNEALFSGVYETYDQCISLAIQEAANLAGTQGGWVYVPAYEQASSYAPSGSQLNFLGQAVPYWLYVAGNGILKEQVPTKASLQEGIAQYVQERVGACDFSTYEQQGYEVNLSVSTVRATVRAQDIHVRLDGSLSVVHEDQRGSVTSRSLTIASTLGTLFDEALRLYQQEKQGAFLENYTVDVLGAYAPVDGVAIQCSPKIWQTREVVDTLRNALEANVQALRFDGSGYFKAGTSEQETRILFSQQWPHRIEIYGAEQSFMKADTVGNQQGLGVLGFCYAPYHFVYDVVYPVLIQLGSGLDGDLFQFPLIVVVDKNQPRKGLESEIDVTSGEDICQYATQPITVELHDVNLQAVDGEVSYTCFDRTCSVGSSEEGIVEGMVPACLNGRLEVRADGYQDKEIMFSSNEESTADIILDRSYNVSVRVTSQHVPLRGNAIVTFSGPMSVSAVYPDFSAIQLAEGLYNVSVMVYGNSSLKIPSSTRTECITVSAGGLVGIFGKTEEQCFPITTPESTLEQALLGGGQTAVYLFPEDLARGVIALDVGKLASPVSLDQVQTIFEQTQSQSVEVSFV